MASGNSSEMSGTTKSTLFPSVANNSSHKQSSLFPAFNQQQNARIPDQKAIEAPPMEWLSNTSFAANLLEPISRKQKVELGEKSPPHIPAKKAQKERDAHSSSEDSSPRYYRSRSRSRSRSKSQSRSRSLSRSPSSKSRSPSPRYDKHKHKKKKKKHKNRREDSPRRHHKEEKRHKHKKKEKKRKRSPVEEKRRKSPVRPSVPPPTAPNRVFVEDVPASAPCYREDRRPDRSNWDFGSLYKQHVAQYRRATDRCLGGRAVLGRDKGSVYKPPPRYYAKEARKVLYVDVYRPLLPCARARKEREGVGGFVEGAEISGIGAVELDAIQLSGQGFISLAKSQTVSDDPSSTKRAYDANPLGIYDAGTALYLQGKFPERSAGQPATELTPTPEQTREQYLRSRTASYNARLHAEPTNIALWLEFVRFQNESSGGASSETSSTTTTKAERDRIRNTKSATREIQAAILEKALEKNPGSVALKLVQLELAEQEFADTEELKKQWKNTVFTHVNHPLIWMRYLEFVRGRVISSTVSSTIKAYTKCLEKLGEIHSGTLKSHAPVPHTVHYMLEIFLELVYILWEANHTEKATSFLQALTELNLFCPPLLHPEPLTAQLEFLETYWESPTARLGETGAKGWAEWLQKRGEGQPLPPVRDREAEEAAEDAIIQSAQDKPHTWLAMEASRQARHWLSWRPDTEQGESEEDCEDPERLILFDDISPALFKLESDFQRLLLVLGFLRLFKVPDPGLFPTSNPAYQRQRKFAPDLGNVDCDIVKSVVMVRASDNEKEFAENLLKQCRRAFSGNYRTLLDVIFVRYLTEQFVETASTLDKKSKKAAAKALKKKVKELLAEEENLNNLVLWESYARMEEDIGNVEDSRKILATALGMSQKRDGRFLKLVVSIAELDIKHGRASSAVCYLVNWAAGLPVAIADDKASPAQILKARNSIQDMLKTAIEDISNSGLKSGTSTDTADSLVEFVLQQNGLLLLTRTFALFQYITVDIGAASEVFRQTIERIRPEDEAFPSEAAYDPGQNLALLKYEVLVEEHVKLLEHHVGLRNEVGSGAGTGIEIVSKKGSVSGQASVSGSVPSTSSVSSSSFSASSSSSVPSASSSSVPLRILRGPLQASSSSSPATSSSSSSSSASSVPLRILRGPLQAALASLPYNSRLLRSYVLLARRCAGGGGLNSPRAYFFRCAARDDGAGAGGERRGLEVGLWAIVSELQRAQDLAMHTALATGQQECITQLGIHHQARAWLERGVGQASGRRAVLLWRLYMAFERSLGRHAALKGVYYRAVQSCPWAKDLYMDLLHTDPSQLQATLDLMAEKEVRVRTPLEELDLLMPPHTEKEDTGNTDDDDMEAEVVS